MYVRARAHTHTHTHTHTQSIKEAINIPTAAPEAFSFRYSYDERLGECIKGHGSIEILDDKLPRSASAASRCHLSLSLVRARSLFLSLSPSLTLFPLSLALLLSLPLYAGALSRAGPSAAFPCPCPSFSTNLSLVWLSRVSFPAHTPHFLTLCVCAFERSEIYVLCGCTHARCVRGTHVYPNMWTLLCVLVLVNGLHLLRCACCVAVCMLGDAPLFHARCLMHGWLMLRNSRGAASSSAAHARNDAPEEGQQPSELEYPGRQDAEHSTEVGGHGGEGVGGKLDSKVAYWHRQSMQSVGGVGMGGSAGGNDWSGEGGGGGERGVRGRERRQSREGVREEKPPWRRGGGVKGPVSARTEAPANARTTHREHEGGRENVPVQHRRRSSSAGRARASLGGGGDASRDRETVGQESEEAKKRSSVSGHASVSARYRDNLSAGVVGKGARDGERRVAAWELEQGLPFDDHKSSCGDGGKGGGGKSGGGRSMHERLTLSCISKITPRRPYVTSPPPGHLEIGHLQ